MLCEKYREDLTNAAAEGAVLTPQLRAHVAACAACAVVFGQERQLFSAIDSGVRLAANAEVPTSLFPRVRVQLNESLHSRRLQVPAWVAVTAAAGVLLAMIAFRARHHETQRQSSENSQVARAVVAPKIPSTTGRNATQAEGRKATAQRKARRSTQISPRVEQVAVLVPPGQRAAVDNLILNLRRGKVDGAALVAENSEASAQELRIAPIEVAPIVVKPLDDAGEQVPGPTAENESLKLK